MLNSEIKFNITLDDHRIPERISFDAPDGGVEDFADPSVRYLGFNVKLTF